ncbi:MAG: NAD-dependent epimerase/dehydratase family protein [Deltaproteobacteria bacterium]|nr:NAD-dependent epimerase/dehydratase family protein [Deltaproteobacteria bacterium]
MRVLITGANGHVGANTVRELLNRNYEVVAFVRESSDLRGLNELDVKYAYGDVMDLDTLMNAADSCDVIVHTAAVFRWWAKDPEEIRQPALVGTRNIFQAAKTAGIQRLVYTSSVVSIGTVIDPEQLLTTDDWNENPHTPYADAKTQSERSAWQMANEYDIPTIVLCPGTVFGPYDYRITPSMSVLQGFVNGSGQTFNSGLAAVDVRDVAAIHAMAVEGGTPGKRYAIVGKNIAFQDLGQMVTDLTGKKVGHFGGGLGMGKMVAGLMEFGARITGKEPALTRALMEDYVGRYQYVDGSPTLEAFGHTPYELRDTIRDSLKWLARIDALKPEIVAGLDKS